MIELDIPGRGNLNIEHLVCDVNGTLAVDGVLIEGITERISKLAEALSIHLLTADTHGGQAAIDAVLGFEAARVRRGKELEQKADYVRQLGPESVVVIGNGGNDAGMLRVAAISIAVLDREGLNTESLQAADIVVTSALDALDLLLKPKRLVATLRR